jgi:hypothetical protein
LLDECSQAADDCTCALLYGNGNAINHAGTSLFMRKGIILQVKREEFISDRMPYIMLRGCWSDIVLNVPALTEDETDDTKDKFYEGLGHMIDEFSKCHMKILLQNFNAKVGGKILSNQKLGMRFYMKLIVIMLLKF